MPTIAEQEIRDVAKRAAEVLKDRGWTRDEFASTDGCVCATGAIRVATGYDPESSAADANSIAAEVTARAVIIATGDREHTGRAHLEIWNDDDSRTADEVIAVLERVAAGEGVA